MIKILKNLRGKHAQTEPAHQDDTPFFIVGCVRSGTTMLRNVLRRHPRLECPEETHFFRWTAPFGSPQFLRPYQHNPVVRKQQEMDGVSREEFDALVAASNSRKELAEKYGQLYLQKRGNPHGRWFDKTPQHFYGMLMISQMFPQARFIHIYRNPLNVVASLFEGKVVSLPDMSAATSYWVEAMAVMTEYKQLGGADRVLEIGYEDFTSNPVNCSQRILEFIGEDEGLLRNPGKGIHPERNRYQQVLGDSDIEEVRRRCMPYQEYYGYT
ncbi:sulfotransferase family protein [Thiolapillus sp.]|uniref:sulfotransferase family protein n=1 Tax=Thiolapillus sp. TaxID=2017437 RepID=UPI003AF7ED51